MVMLKLKTNVWLLLILSFELDNILQQFVMCISEVGMDSCD